MSRKPSSQWDFGELFPKEAARKVLTVAELTGEIKRTLQKQIGQIWVTGEITNLRAQGSGHMYFTLKDAAAQLSCVLFRGEALDVREALRDGQKVVLNGDLTVYEPRGQYQLRVTAVELQGIGALQVAFEKLKQKLAAEGLFAPERKRALPRFPQRIGIVTSGTGAAIRDVIHVIMRRDPGLELMLASCRVQGAGAADEIACAIELLNQWSAAQEPGQRLDLILVTRGGGSLEDLWAFNEEPVARAIFESYLPVISAVGHEIDFTISDFVADFRTATPSAAAEIITAEAMVAREFVLRTRQRLGQLARRRLNEQLDELDALAGRLARMHPRRKLNETLQRLDDLQFSLVRCARVQLREHQNRFARLLQRLSHIRPSAQIKQRREVFGQTERRFQELAQHQLERLQARLQQAESKLRLLGPENVLQRGYSITMDAESGEIVRDAAKVKPGQKLKTRVKSGEIRSQVE
ncbi:MAG: exodeoxyribonuclease large subunit [Verrucomicrobia bacterium]|jgi:exodeoxyribonuclease VII large subunit|nr:exodeoxyribonuclease large subunit [Verrucomicrobiota bacterium]